MNDKAAFDLSAFHAIAADPHEMPEYWGNIRCCQEMGAEQDANSGSAIRLPLIAVYLARVREGLD